MHRGFYAVNVKRQCSKDIEQKQNSDIIKGYNIYLINIYTFTKFGEILSICPQDIAQKQNYVANQGP